MIGFHDWKVRIAEDFGGIVVNVWLYRNMNGKYEVLRFNDENGAYIISEHENGVDVQPSLKVPSDIWQLIANSLSEVSVPSSTDQTMARLEATEYHLEDMRKLVFGGKK